VVEPTWAARGCGQTRGKKSFDIPALVGGDVRPVYLRGTEDGDDDTREAERTISSGEKSQSKTLYHVFSVVGPDLSLARRRRESEGVLRSRGKLLRAVEKEGAVQGARDERSTFLR